MNAHTIPVTFPNKDGLRLFGVLHQPAVPRDPGVAILLLSPGVKMRVAPHRLYNKMAARFVALGYPVLRFDFHGLGDSEGEAPDTLLADLYGATQVGRYIADTIAAMDWMHQQYGTSRFIASGLCGGALTGLLAAQRDPRITSLLGLSIPVILDGSTIDASKYMTDAQLKGTRLRYLRKFRLWDPDVWHSWVRFFSFQSHYSLILKSMAKPLLARLRRAAPVAPATAEAPEAKAADNTNPYFAPALLRMVSTGRRVFLIFAETDRLLWEFDVKFLQRHRAAVERHADWFEMHVTKQANHIFSFGEWQEDMLDQCCRWLERSGGERRAAAPASAIPVGVPSH
ncbi:MAG: alpha/beta hydrolase [Vicinamibacterales bacterium]